MNYRIRNPATNYFLHRYLIDLSKITELPEHFLHKKRPVSRSVQLEIHCPYSEQVNMLFSSNTLTSLISKL